jgi:kynurenine formamidase
VLFMGMHACRHRCDGPSSLAGFWIVLFESLKEQQMKRRNLLGTAGAGALLAGTALLESREAQAAGPEATRRGTRAPSLWQAWDTLVRPAKFVSLSHVLTQDLPLWQGFPPTTAFARGKGRLKDTDPYAEFRYETIGLETTSYTLATDQMGTQLDPPAHWHQCMPAIDELPPTLALRKLCVISIADRVAADPAYALTVADVKAWEARHGAVPPGSVVMVRSDWYKRWPDKAAFVPADGRFPGVSLQALKYLHQQRRILFHGHEPLDTDATPTLIGEDWLMNNGYPQAEGVANLDQVPETGALVTVGYPRFRGGTGGIASFVAICPPGWPHGTAPDLGAESPFPLQPRRLVWDAQKGRRERTAACDKPKGKGSFNDFGKP